MWTTRKDAPEAQFPEHRDGNLGGPEAWCEARNTMPQAGARSFFAAGRWAASREAVKRSGTGGAGSASRLAVGCEVVGGCE